MKKNIIISIETFILLFFSFLFSGCLKDNCSHANRYTWLEPLYRTSAEVRANIKSNQPQKIENPGKIFIRGNYIFLNEINKGIHVIDNSRPSAPVNIAFINIPGNVDIAVKGNTLYADLYTDLVTLDISDPANVVKKNILDGVFPAVFFGGMFLRGDSGKIVYDWVRHDTTVYENCDASGWNYPGVAYLADASQAGNKSAAGIGGSTSRFALLNNYLYTVGENNLNAFNISNSNQPSFTNSVQVDWHVETIYPFQNKLFVGSNNGMFIYDVQSNPSLPSKIGEFTHARACDPVIADDKYAYITLHSGTECLGFNNQLDVVQLNNFTDASLVKTYNLTSPRGLSKDGNLLFICDGTDGVKVYNAADASNLKLITQIPGAETYDVIAYNKVAIVVSTDGLYQYDYSDVKNIHLISKISILK
ncbi:MAG: hypothetical protein ABI594_02370 [Ginsengibacter sp.]